jgi:hypothetical protein
MRLGDLPGGANQQIGCCRQTDFRLPRRQRDSRNTSPSRSEKDQFAANRGEVQPPQTQGHDQSATLPLLAST